MAALTLDLRRTFHGLGPGLAVSGVVAIAATFLSLRYDASSMLFALLLGMGLNFLSEDGRCVPGIQLASGLVLRTGVALLGLRITIGHVAGLGWTTLALVIASVVFTIAAGVLGARLLRLGNPVGLLTGGAVAICGASAALAVASVLPKYRHLERDAGFAVVGVTALSTVAMIAYPVVAGVAGLDPRSAGVFLGATIHDVAQVVGAGYGMSVQTGDTATVVKLLRVAMLLPVCVALGLVLHVRQSGNARSRPLLPWFAVAFAVLVVIASSGRIPGAMLDAGSTLSRWCLVIAIAAIGMKTSLRALMDIGAKAVVLLVFETLFLAVLVLGALHFPM